MRFLFPTVEREKVSERSVKTFAVGPGGFLSLNTTLGSIHVNAGATNEVSVEVLLQVEAGSRESAGLNLKDLQLSFTQNGNDVAINSEFQGSKKGLTLEFRISAPRHYNVRLKTAAGNISVGGLEGETHADTAGGNIEVMEVRGNVNANTAGGSISIEQVEGRVKAQTAGGGIRVENLIGEIEAVTKGGNVAARLSNQIADHCYLATSGGQVRVELNHASGFDVDAKTRAGSLVTEFPITMQGKLSGTSCKSSINGGGPKLVLRSGAGDIHLLKL